MPRAPERWTSGDHRIRIRLTRTRTLLIAATAAVVLLITTWPTHPFVGHAHWALVEWVPFSRVFSVRDLCANVALFVPLGAVIAWPSGRSRALAAVLTGLALSVLAETYQVYCHAAFPSTADVGANTLGAALGAWLVRRRRARTREEVIAGAG